MHRNPLLKLYTFLIVTAAGFTSCEVINPDEPVPSYISIDSVHFTTFYNTQGTASNAFVDSWVYVDNVLQGGYEMPFTIPVIKSGTHTISIQPGIKVNGLNAARNSDPLITFYDTILNLEPGKTAKISPQCTYVSGAKFFLIDDFDDGGNQFALDTISNTTFFVTSNAFEGPFSGGFAFDDSHTVFSAVTINHYVLPRESTTMLELNFKCSNTFQVGVKRTYFGQSIRDPIITLLPTNGIWKKIYINLTDEIRIQYADYYNVYIYSQRDSTSGTSEVLLDNIKLVHN